MTTRANLPYLNWAVIGDVENTMFKVSQLSHYILKILKQYLSSICTPFHDHHSESDIIKAFNI